jgi:hypothetical protein
VTLTCVVWLSTTDQHSAPSQGSTQKRARSSLRGERQRWGLHDKRKGCNGNITLTRGGRALLQRKGLANWLRWSPACNQRNHSKHRATVNGECARRMGLSDGTNHSQAGRRWMAYAETACPYGHKRCRSKDADRAIALVFMPGPVTWLGADQKRAPRSLGEDQIL